MNIHSKEGLIFIAQIDHLTGECIGQVIDLFYQAGASNVQVVPTITKKNRPAYMFFIDCRPKFADAVERIIAQELGSGGWHCINTTHRYQCNEIIQKTIVVEHGMQSFLFTAEGKRFEYGSVRPEHENVAVLKQKVRDNFDMSISYYELYHAVMSVLRGQGDENETPVIRI
ncbi:MAG: DUF111 family protein [Lachnospiraceae bacterium]|nr:DUF111 family protein [Lachnospiraceae bacterium]